VSQAANKPTPQSLLNATVVNIVTDAAVEALEKLGHLAASVGAVRKATHLPSAPAVSASIRLSEGEAEVQACWAFDGALVPLLTASFFPGLDATALNIPAEDTVGELANILVGVAARMLEDAGLRVKVHIPRVVPMSDAPIRLLEPGVEIPLQFPAGLIRVVVGVRLV